MYNQSLRLAYEIGLLLPLFSVTNYGMYEGK